MKKLIVIVLLFAPHSHAQTLQSSFGWEASVFDLQTNQKQTYTVTYPGFIKIPVTVSGWTCTAGYISITKDSSGQVSEAGAILCEEQNTSSTVFVSNVCFVAPIKRTDSSELSLMNHAGGAHQGTSIRLSCK